MVELRRDNEIQGPVVTAFTQSGFKIGDNRYDEGLLISPEQAFPWEAPTIDSLDLSAILSSLDVHPKPEFMIFGSGANMVQPPSVFRREVEAAGMGLEVMDSRAAARTWGVLRAEDRWIIGAFLPLTRG